MRGIRVDFSQTKWFTRRHLTTLCYLLRGYAVQQRRMHGRLVERLGGIGLTPTEMDAWADELEARSHDHSR